MSPTQPPFFPVRQAQVGLASPQDKHACRCHRAPPFPTRLQSAVACRPRSSSWLHLATKPRSPGVGVGRVVVVGGAGRRGITGLRAAQFPGSHALGILGIGHLVLVDAVGVQGHGVQGQFIRRARIPAVVSRVAAHLEAACGDEDHLAGDHAAAVRGEAPN